MHQQENGMITFEQYKHYVKWYSSHEDSWTRVTDQLMNTCLTNGLFCKTDDGFIYSKRVLQNKEFREELSKKRSIAWKKSAEVRAKATSVEQNWTHVEQGKERKGKENKIKEIDTEIVASTKNENEDFFKKIETDTDSVISDMNIPPEHIENARREFFKFWNYWTEKDMRGKERWRKEKTFEAKRRLTTWLLNTKQFTSNQKTNGKRFAD